MKVNYLLAILFISAIGAFATSKKSNFLDLCFTVPSTNGPSINPECPYIATTQCCYIAAGSSSQYVTQTQPSGTVVIRRNPSQMTTIMGIGQ